MFVNFEGQKICIQEKKKSICSLQPFSPTPHTGKRKIMNSFKIQI